MRQSVRALVRRRAKNRCEYCHVPQEFWGSSLHIEHILAQQHTVDDRPSNLALACDRCNLLKGPNLTSIDPASGEVVMLFNPRQDKWDEHFEYDGPWIVGITSVGRATVTLLRMNERVKLKLRETLIQLGKLE
jgi:HNH endonuclease